MRAHYSCIKVTLLILNTVFLIVGIILFAVGGYAHSQLMEVSELVSTGLPIGIIILGVLIFLLSFFGCCGAIIENRLFLLIYIFILLALMICQIAIGGAAYHLAENIDIGLKEKWDALSTAHKIEIQKQFDCCGFDDSRAPDDTHCLMTEPPCGSLIVDFYRTNITIIGVLGVIFGCLEIVGFCTAFVLYCCLGRKHRREKRERLLG